MKKFSFKLQISKYCWGMWIFVERRGKIRKIILLNQDHIFRANTRELRHQESETEPLENCFSQSIRIQQKFSQRIKSIIFFWENKFRGEGSRAVGNFSKKIIHCGEHKLTLQLLKMFSSCWCSYSYSVTLINDIRVIGVIRVIWVWWYYNN